MPQFLLTAEEYEALAPKAELETARATIATLSRKVAKLTLGYCIHDPDPKRKGNNLGGYCDDCGMADFNSDAPRCPFPRNFSH